MQLSPSTAEKLFDPAESSMSGKWEEMVVANFPFPMSSPFNTVEML